MFFTSKRAPTARKHSLAWPFDGIVDLTLSRIWVIFSGDPAGGTNRFIKFFDLRRSQREVSTSFINRLFFASRIGCASVYGDAQTEQDPKMGIVQDRKEGSTR